MRAENLNDVQRIKSAEEFANKAIGALSLEEKIGQLFFARLDADYTNLENPKLQKAIDFIKKYNIGGFYLTRGTPIDVAVLTNYLQSQSRVPLIFAADFESGVGRLIKNATLFPKQMLIGATGDPNFAYLSGKITAIESRAIGVQVLFCPVADVNSNPMNPIINIRSFGSNPENISKFVEAYIKGAQENGVAATAKHFPGHGDADSDSHIQIPVIKVDKSHLYAIELPPFQSAIKSNVFGIMTSHISIPAIEPDIKTPASLSHAILTNLLRKELGFEGVIFTDGLDMDAILYNFTIEDACTKALLAGSDVLLIPPQIEKCFSSIMKEVNSGTIPLSRLDESVKRILKLKAILGLNENRYVDVNNVNHIVASNSNLETAKNMFDSGITLVKDADNSIPVKMNREIRCLNLNLYDSTYWEQEVYQTVSIELQKRFSMLLEIDVPYASSIDVMKNIQNEFDKYDLIIANIFIKVKPYKASIELSETQISILKDLSKRVASPTNALSQKKNLLLISYGNPYIISNFIEFPCIILTFDYSQEAIKSAYRAVFGEIPIKGVLPVEIPGLFDVGHSLKRPQISQSSQEISSPILSIQNLPKPEEVESHIATDENVSTTPLQKAKSPFEIDMKEMSQTSLFMQETEQKISSASLPTLTIAPHQTHSGLDVFLEKHLDEIKGKRIGVITNNSGITMNKEPIVEVLKKIPDVQVTAIFSPEHGYKGGEDAGKTVKNGVEENIGIPIISLFGRTLKPTPDMLKDIDILIYDIQDAGVRFYTYISTLGYCLEAAEENGKKIIVLDRPNPISANFLDGWICEKEQFSFVGRYPIPVVYGLTIGELANMLVGEGMLENQAKPDFEVIKMNNWNRSMFYDITLLPFVKPSPNLPTLDCIIAYPATCYFEGTNISEGRGTPEPFLNIGAPFIDGDLLSKKLNLCNLPGVIFDSTSFTPVSIPGAIANPKYKGEKCGGVHLKITKRANFRPMRTICYILYTLLDLYPSKVEFKVEHFDHLAGTKSFREDLQKHTHPEIILKKYEPALLEFNQKRQKYFLYD